MVGWVVTYFLSVTTIPFPKEEFIHFYTFPAAWKRDTDTGVAAEGSQISGKGTSAM